MNSGKKKLPIGIESFEEIQKEQFYYVDKTGLIGELLRNWSKVNLFTRPRRFGKSLNMSMLKCFFELGSEQALFDGLEISEDSALCEAYRGKFPVISVSMKGISGTDIETARAMLCSVIGKEAMRFQFLLESEKLTKKEKEMYHQLTTIDRESKQMFLMPDSVLMESLQTLSMLLERHYGQKVIVLIDEYDVPLAKAFEYGYYEEMVILMRNVLEQVLKTNASLQFAVLTGCMRISKESIFTGLNNLRVFSSVQVEFDEYFGFTDSEVKALLEYYGLSEKYEIMKAWYDGYQFGNTEVYCPWDVMNYCASLRVDLEAQPQNFWANTSSNEAVRKLLQKADKGMIKREIERLVAGEAIRKEIRQELTYKDMYASVEHIWSLLFTAGYLTQRGRPEGDCFYLAIPNIEIQRIFTTQIMELFKENMEKDGEAVQSFCEALQRGDAAEVERQFGGYLRKTISIRDTFSRKSMKENFYHGILLGILSFKNQWSVSSNKESGEGYSDIIIELDEEEMGILIEVKYAEDGNLEEGCKKALAQIEEKYYEEVFREDGMTKILKYGIACYKKQCRVQLSEE